MTGAKDRYSYDPPVYESTVSSITLCLARSPASSRVPLPLLLRVLSVSPLYTSVCPPAAGCTTLSRMPPYRSSLASAFPPVQLANSREAYRDLLIFEERLKQNSIRLAGQRNKYEGEQDTISIRRYILSMSCCFQPSYFPSSCQYSTSPTESSSLPRRTSSSTTSTLELSSSPSSPSSSSSRRVSTLRRSPTPTSSYHRQIGRYGITIYT